MLSADHQRPDYAGAVRYIEDTGAPSSPVVDTIGFTPGAQTAIEAAFAPKGQAFPRGRQVLTLGFPTLQERLRVRQRGESVIAPESIPGDLRLAREAVRAAGGSGTIFVVTGGASLEQIRLSGGHPTNFLNALPPRFHEVASRNFPGLGYAGIRVHVLRGS